ncbi:MAG: hypothetical protein B7Z36_05480 [Novosphingobium sp. 12-63-9]|nr:MAG: hypothetical protein B7Z36_05480 [Novosphingobium sp. 12-63-9]
MFFREPHLTATTDPTLIEQPHGARELMLKGPSAVVDPLHRPVRGDLAHIRCAGTVFVPHYAVPMPHTVSDATALRKAGRADADVIADLAAGEVFNVLDMSGGWAWGQQGDAGFVGYVPLTSVVAQ